MQDADRSWLVVPGADEATTRRSLFDQIRARPAFAATLAAGAVAAVVVAGLALTVTAATPRIDLAALGSADPRAGIADGSPGGGAGGIVVDVGGAVRTPGLYRLTAGSRVGDAIQAAGGFAPTVDAAAVARDLNLAASLTDGQKVIVAARGSSSATTAPGPAPGGALVDLNHASESELDALPGIGPVTAKKIIAARAERPFASAQELVERKLVGEKTWEKLRDLVTAG